MFLESMDTGSMLLYLTRLMVIFLVFPLHEFAHAFAAHCLGDDTARNQGRMTIDPVVHLDPFGALLMLLCGFGWAKPVPVNPQRFRHKNFGMLLVAVAGPFVNLLAALGGIAAIRLCGGFGQFIMPELWRCIPDGSPMGYLMWMLYVFCDVNIVLFLFNMLPVPPMDGSRVLLCFLPPRAAVWFMKYSRIFYGIVFILMITGFLPLSRLGDKIACGMVQLVSFLPVVV